MIASQTVYDYVLKPLTQEPPLKNAKTERELLTLISSGGVYHGQRKVRREMDEAMADLLSGSAVLVFDGEGVAVSFDSKGYEKRGVTEPTNENVLKGSKEAFIESMRVNTSLVRRRIQTDSLKAHQLTIGRRTNTAVTIMFLEGVANPAAVELVKMRLEALDVDGFISAGQIESALSEKRRTVFPQVLYTERVDKFCGNLLEGRVGVITDGIPVAYITPVDLNAFLQAPEDYTQNALASTMFRILRHICAFAALILPAFYVSITAFHQEMVPTKLAVSIISSKQGVPFPTYMEVLLMLLAFEVLLEAGLRLPRSIGQAVSIVGALVVGQAAITANILSPGVVIIIAAAGMIAYWFFSRTGLLIPTLLSMALVCLLYTVFHYLVHKK
jgi:spore germination protein KA